MDISKHISSALKLKNIQNHYPEFKGAWCLADYIPASPDKISQSLISYKYEEEDCVRKWNHLALQQLLSLQLPFDLVVRNLGSKELVADNCKPLDDLCNLIIWSTEAKYYPSLLQKRCTTRAFHNLNYTQRRGELKNVFFIKDCAHLKAKNILLIDDIVTTGITLNTIRNILEKQFPEAAFYFFTLAQTISRYARQEKPKY